MKRFELGCVAEERDGLVRGGGDANDAHDDEDKRDERAGHEPGGTPAVVALLKTTRREESGWET